MEEKQTKHQPTELQHCDNDILRDLFPHDITAVQPEANIDNCNATPLPEA
jgi:hypothetical protein